MKMLMRLIVGLILSWCGVMASADEEVIPIPLEPGDAAEAEIPIRTPTAKETAEACKKYEGRFIGYYGRVFRVENCKKRATEDAETVFQITLQKNTISSVDADVIAAIPDGSPLTSLGVGQAVRGCKQLNGNYITHNFAEIYFVENCRLVQFPDYETFVDHRKRTSRLKADIVSVSFAELQGLGKNTMLPSVLDEKANQSAAREAPVEVIPIDEACKGLNDQYVSFYSRMYKIEKCRKRPVDPERLLLKSAGKINPKELKPEQWISIPDGPPLNL